MSVSPVFEKEDSKSLLEVVTVKSSKDVKIEKSIVHADKALDEFPTVEVLKGGKTALELKDDTPGIIIPISLNGAKATTKKIDPKVDETWTKGASSGGSLAPLDLETTNTNGSDVAGAGGPGNPSVANSEKASVGKKVLASHDTVNKIESALGSRLFKDPEMTT